MSPATAAPRPRAALLAAATLALLVAASVAALFFEQGLKRRPPLLKRPHAYTDVFAPAGPGGRPLDRAAHFRLQATVGDRVDVYVVTLSGRPVAALATALRVHEYRSVWLHWNGRTSTGTPAPAGTYLLRVHFEHGGQTVTVPGFRLALRRPAG